jgi:DNA primase
VPLLNQNKRHNIGLVVCNLVNSTQAKGILHRMLFALVRNFGISLLILGLLTGCAREPVAPGDPVAAVEGLAGAIRDNNLVSYSKLSLPPQLHAQIEQRWTAELALTPELTEVQRKDHARYMKQMMAPGAEAQLFLRYQQKHRQFQSELNSQWPLMQKAAQIFVNSAIQANENLTPPERDHAKAVSQAILQWLKPSVFNDKEKVREAIAVICKTAREVDLPQAEQMHQLSMTASLEKTGLALKGLKNMARIYDVDLDDSLDNMQAKVIDSNASGNEATVEVNYVLLTQDIRFEIKMTRIDGRWYPADSVQDAQQTLKQALPAAAVSAH